MTRFCLRSAGIVSTEPLSKWIIYEAVSLVNVTSGTAMTQQYSGEVVYPSMVSGIKETETMGPFHLCEWHHCR